jgi:hypothetical protein
LERLETGLSNALNQCSEAIRQGTKHQASCPVLNAMKGSRGAGLKS